MHVAPSSMPVSTPWLKDRTVEQEEVVVGKQCDCKHTSVVTNTHARVEELLVEVFSM
jgi:hypothetical protein